MIFIYLVVWSIDRPNIQVYKIKGKRSGEKERLGASLTEWAHDMGGVEKDRKSDRKGKE
jgi:hypothetical protein